MHIEGIDVHTLRFDYPDGRGFRYAGGLVTSRVTTVIQVHTDSPHVGLGAAYSHPDLVRLIIERHLAPHLLGADPTEVEALWKKMYGLTLWYGRKGAAITALGGLDIAFWDLRGKAAGKPIYELLGAERAFAPAYASGLFWQDDVRAIEEEATRHRANGFRRVKMRLGRSEAYDVAAVEAARRGVGADGDVLVDGSHRYTMAVAERMGKVLEANRVFWFEEPFPPEDLDSYVALQPKLTVPLAAGENEFGVQGFRELLRAGAVGIAQPDACRTGGISESLRIAEMARPLGVRIAPHTWSDAVALTANAHVVAALPHGVTVEVDQTGNPSIEQLLVEPLHIEDGKLLLSRAPGLGVELNPQTLNRLRVPPGQLMLDGNYSDLIFGPEHYAVAPPYEERRPSGRPA
ncbi:MAG TPA: mandelate racemase/muconate lactonizing enzyme family protein [Candidatus Limnocylindrales bacterium]|nr:mandelate racemase/muconate lactonizing enzyme family protein [Candidatus Limnocylindrales bacterium]